MDEGLLGLLGPVTEVTRVTGRSKVTYDVTGRLGRLTSTSLKSVLHKELEEIKIILQVQVAYHLY
ncbi:hypothetical protein N7456_010025 [Penicillium angulare]|uniref:Uncharacterized protein n=1 Tax=Penicillium angulare TaxID=116970 RepID=A0A9W9F5W2_9EURO|nr:hypothetical protein N7456_010025 [Penicillium angulare]